MRGDTELHAGGSERIPMEECCHVALRLGHGLSGGGGVGR